MVAAQLDAGIGAESGDAHRRRPKVVFRREDRFADRVPSITSNVFVQSVGDGEKVGVYWNVHSAAILNGATFVSLVLAHELIRSNVSLAIALDPKRNLPWTMCCEKAQHGFSSKLPRVQEAGGGLKVRRADIV